MEKEKKTEVQVLKFKFRSYKSISIGSVPRFLYLLWRHRAAAHQSWEEKNNPKFKKSQNFHLSSFCKHWFSQKVSTLHLDVPGYIFHPITKYHKLYSGITRKKQYCLTWINIKRFVAVSSWSELRPLKSCIIWLLEKLCWLCKVQQNHQPTPWLIHDALMAHVIRKAAFHQPPNEG